MHVDFLPPNGAEIRTHDPIDTTHPTQIESALRLVFILPARRPRCNQLLETIPGTTHSD